MDSRPEAEESSFDRVGVKTVMVRYANLELDGEGAP